MQEPESPTAIIASRTPCSSLTSSWASRMPKVVAVERDGLVEVGHGDADVVDRGEQVAGERRRHGRVARSCRAWLQSANQRSKVEPSHPWRGIRHVEPPRSSGGPAMSDNPSVIVAGARTPIGRLLGGLKDLSAADLGGVAIKGALEKAGVAADQVDYVIMGQVIQAGAGQNPARGAAVGRRDPDERPVDHHQQGLPLRPQRDRDGRPADPRRRGRDRRRRRHGVDDQRAAPAAEVPRGLQVRRRHAGRLDGLRRALRPVHRPGDGAADRGEQRRRANLTREEQDAFSARVAPAGRRGLEERPVRRRGRPGRGPAAQGRPGRWSPPTRASAATPPPSRWPSCARRSARTAPSPPARPRRSPTAPPRSW